MIIKYVLPLAFLLLAGCQPGSEPAEAVHAQSGLIVEDAWVRAMPDPLITRTAAYLTISNRTDQADRLLAVEVDGVAAVEIHETVLTDGVMRMRETDDLEIPPGETVSLAPGELHIMLIGMERTITEGDSLSITLRFAVAGERTVTAPVRSI